MGGAAADETTVYDGNVSVSALLPFHLFVDVVVRLVVIAVAIVCAEVVCGDGGGLCDMLVL